MASITVEAPEKLGVALKEVLANANIWLQRRNDLVNGFALGLGADGDVNVDLNVWPYLFAYEDESEDDTIAESLESVSPPEVLNNVSPFKSKRGKDA